MSTPAVLTQLETELADALGERVAATAPAIFRGDATLASAYPVSALASASTAVAGRALAALLVALERPEPGVTVDRGLADDWFGLAVRPVGWALPSPWDAVAGDYAAADGWIRLHTNAPHHRAAALRVLGVAGEREAVSAAVGAWRADELEAAVVGEGGAAAAMRTSVAWAAHPQGAAVAAEPIVARELGAFATAPSGWRPTADRPLAGLRVLDLTRVLAGPAATRLLAGLGAEVLRIDPPDWQEPALEPDMTLGKRTARLDARDPAGLDALRALLERSDVLVHGYRADALERLGLGAEVRRALRPGLVDVSLDAYGHTGPWALRRGFDSLVQLSAGLADTGMRAAGSPTSVALPVQALDQGTGMLAAAAVLAGLAERVAEGTGSRRRLSLARTAAVLERARTSHGAEPMEAAAPDAAQPRRIPISTAWGDAELLAPALTVAGAPLRWERTPRPLGSDPATF